MTQYVVLMYERETSDGVADVPAEVMEAHGELPGRIIGKGGRILAAMAFEPSRTATAIRGDLVTDGPFAETGEALTGAFVIEARDFDHALSLAMLTPIVNGGVEVRPLIGFEIMTPG